MESSWTGEEHQLEELLNGQIDSALPCRRRRRADSEISRDLKKFRHQRRADNEISRDLKNLRHQRRADNETSRDLKNLRRRLCPAKTLNRPLDGPVVQSTLKTDLGGKLSFTRAYDALLFYF